MMKELSHSHNNSNELETNKLIKEFQANPENEMVKAMLIKKYERLVKGLARKFTKQLDNHEDLVQVGMVGLYLALKRFDPSISKHFESYAVPTIIGEIKRYIRDKTWSVRVPRRFRDLGPKISKAVDELTIQMQRSPKIFELADYLGVTEEEVLETIEVGKNYQALSMDYKLENSEDGGAITLLEKIGSKEQGFKTIEDKLYIESLCNILEEREIKIIHLIYAEQLSQKEVGKQIGISQMHVSRVLKGALNKLREAYRDKSYIK
jgi:RNA polymerase sigma-B factor